MNEVYIIDCKRIPVGLIGGQYQNLEPEQLLKPLFDFFRGNHPDLMNEIDDVIIGNTIGKGGNIARLSLLYAGLDESIPGVTVDRQCGSGLEAINMACRMVQSGAGSIYLAGGVESVSRAPWRIEKPKQLYDNQPIQSYTKAPFSPESIGDPTMIEAAENVAEHYDISREIQDAFAEYSYQKFNSAQAEDWIQDEVVTFGPYQEDEGIRDIALQRLQRYKPLISEGTVTIGNSCRLNDGAALALIVSKEMMTRYNLAAKLKFIDAQNAGTSPLLLGSGPIFSTRKLLDRQDLTIEDIDIVEFNEAFASQVVASVNALDISHTQLNPYGGALALGHPYAASGAMLIARLCNYSSRQQTTLKLLATIGIGGGQGITTLFESVG